ncbi:phosphatase PAP2 family protein [Halovenus sp. WSH3]|uniref:Phosphatase PAP2 family protein n=1 Tax=Halovenus carboxidivorans TaxID=2692199 RepID=A0A6B0T9K1_9EURY|nr:phosphatase PAP2 family protein [Halovenus carboxidivorans]MXR51921.1 phosphatase PAP2 family protein [Halovenus carboxidivorans]
MSFLSVSVLIGAVVIVGLVATCAICLTMEQIQQTATDLTDRLSELAPYLLLAGVFFLIRRFTQGPSQRLSREIGIPITDEIFQIEGLFVAHLQNLAPELLIPVFSGFYMFGFAFLLVAPIALYLLTPALRPLKELLVAYILNYAAGAFLYTVFVAVGPRNHLAKVDGLMYQFYPQTSDVTSVVSENTDVFPSLHTSLSVIVLLFAWQTRDLQPRWLRIATVITTGIVLATMILGIHWATDVVAGIALAVGCVYFARYIVGIAENRLGSYQSQDAEVA